ncbi:MULTISPECIES: O-antigen ligase family protein [unclassified Bradyrhizobium]|uniref:O-antigen ligase family protein n=1 Tax=unclassified Bradyrhizobium TaxID=2631580 RepID=UPI002916C34F|nr:MULTISPECIES: O-antigen ligase family protein [unclassified Bradyrhizobium]
MKESRIDPQPLAAMAMNCWPSALLLAATALAAPALGGIVRPAFILGCAVAGWFAWRRSPAAHVQSAILMFAFAPFVRRLVDISAGFDSSGVMLSGPLLFIIAPVPSLVLSPSDKDRPGNPWLVAPFIVLACIVYGGALSIFQNDWFNAANGGMKWAAPVLYAIALQQRARSDGALLDAITRVFLLVLPVTGLYGIWQYVDPQGWDRFWMVNASITSAGYPLPYMVRVFSTMNGPASYATFTATGLLLVGFLRPGWLAMAAMAPAALGLLLSLYRTSWITLAVGVLFCMLFPATRRRAVSITVGLVGAVIVTVMFTPFAEVITSRLESLGSASQDSSGSERLDEFVTLWNAPNSMVLGSGFTITDVGVAGAMPIDGQIIASWVTMGIPVGLICLAAYVWVGLAATGAAWRIPTREGAVLGALAISALLIQLPLTSISSGEVSALFWMLVAMACPLDQMADGARRTVAARQHQAGA